MTSRLSGVEFFHGQINDPVNIGADDADFGRHRRHLIEPLEFLHGNGFGLVGQVGRLDLLLQLDGVAGEDIAFAQFVLDLPHLLAEIELALALIHFVLDTGVDLVLQLQHIHFLGQDLVDGLQTCAGLEERQQALAGIVVQGKGRGDHVRQPAGLGNVHCKEMGFFGDGAIQLDAAVEQIEDRAHQGLGLAVRGLRFEDGAGAHLQIRPRAHEVHDLDAPAPLHQGRGGAIRHREQASDRHLDADRQEIGGLGILDLGVLLHEADQGPILGLGFLHGKQRGLTPDKDRGDHAREDDQITQRQDRGLDQAVFVRFDVRHTIKLFRALRERQVEVFFFFVPVRL